jgi:hypothetical protein
VKNTGQYPCQTIYVINQDKKDVDYVTVILQLMRFFVHVVKQSLDQNQEIRKYGIRFDEILWFDLEEKLIGS